MQHACLRMKESKEEEMRQQQRMKVLKDMSGTIRAKERCEDRTRHQTHHAHFLVFLHS